MRTVIDTKSLKLDLNDREILTAVNHAFAEANAALEPAFDLEFTRSKWYWPNAPSPRDIIADGVLRQSYVRSRDGQAAFLHSWNTRYAMAVHEGAVFGGVDSPSGAFPGRPWTIEPLKRFDASFAAFARARLERIT